MVEATVVANKLKKLFVERKGFPENVPVHLRLYQPGLHVSELVELPNLTEKSSSPRTSQREQETRIKQSRDNQRDPNRSRVRVPVAR